MKCAELELSLEEQRDNALALFEHLRRAKLVNEMTYQTGRVTITLAFNEKQHEFFVEFFKAARASARIGLVRRLREVRGDVDKTADINLALSRLDAGERLVMIFAQDKPN